MQFQSSWPLPGCGMCSTVVQSIATEIAKDEYNHVVFLRTALGAAAVAMPQVRMLPSCRMGSAGLSTHPAPATATEDGSP